MCFDGCNYKHNMECNCSLMIVGTWESVSNHVCSLIFKSVFGQAISARWRHLVATHQIKILNLSNMNNANEYQMSGRKILS